VVSNWQMIPDRLDWAFEIGTSPYRKYYRSILYRPPFLHIFPFGTEQLNENDSSHKRARYPPFEIDGLGEVYGQYI